MIRCRRCALAFTPTPLQVARAKNFGMPIISLQTVLPSLALLFALLRLVRPELTHSPVKADFEAPADVKRILQTSCYACHSSETRLSWFDQIVPAYQLVALDVKRARMVLNFSELGAQSKRRQNAVLFESVSQIQMGAMPLPRYTLLHPEAVVTVGDLAILRQYLVAASPVRPAAQPEIEAADAQYRRWINEGRRSLPVQAAPNGIAFPSGYNNWRAVSSTDRTDTNTLKMILGNEVAIQAVADHKSTLGPTGQHSPKFHGLGSLIRMVKSGRGSSNK